jgi:hypothetical protein
MRSWPQDIEGVSSRRHQYLVQRLVDSHVSAADYIPGGRRIGGGITGLFGLNMP